jgi:hypothetical protein
MGRRHSSVTERVYTIEVCPICRTLLEVLTSDDVSYELGCPEHGIVEPEYLEVVPKS